MTYRGQSNIVLNKVVRMSIPTNNLLALICEPLCPILKFVDVDLVVNVDIS